MSAVERHTEFDLPHDARADDGMEHMIVTGEVDDSAEAERRAYLDHRRGMYLYGQSKFDEALPYLISSAKHGYKEAQARLAHLYLHGLGGVRRNDVVGVAWMGVAAHGETTPIIQRRYDELMSAVPPHHMAALKKVVEQYVEKYGSFEQTVVCEIAKHASTFISKNRCYFEYEFAVLSALEIADMQDFYRDQIIPPDQLSSFSGLDNMSARIPIPAPVTGGGGGN
ncbi:MAG: sel1 repeat family protein [Gammaproteobacteria bacterium]|nr:sel1 repeat family protein [Gammaproteobacteria bacterium]